MLNEIRGKLHKLCEINFSLGEQYRNNSPTTWDWFKREHQEKFDERDKLMQEILDVCTTVKQS